jgi:hypothetical protein
MRFLFCLFLVQISWSQLTVQQSVNAFVEDAVNKYAKISFEAIDMESGEVIAAYQEKLAEQQIPAAEGLDRIREIAGTQVVMELNPNAGGIPEIKAGSKEKAIEIARKKGIKTFKFCGRYKVKAGKPEQGPMVTPASIPAAVGNPSISRTTAPGNPNTRPGSLRDRAAQANAARRPDEPRFK